MEQRKVIIDTDPGVDDVLALILALKSMVLDVHALTVVAGNVSLDACTSNALRVLEFLDLAQTPEVFSGCAEPISGCIVRTEHVHGSDGFGSCSAAYPVTRLEPSKRHAVDYILEAARQYGDELSLICLGPLTNIAMALEQDAPVLSKIREIIIMGGSLDEQSNVTSKAEYNFYADPAAARQVLQSGIPSTLVGLNVTMQVIMTRERFQHSLESSSNSRLTSFLDDLTRNLFELYKETRNLDGFALHDPLAVAMALDPTLLTVEPFSCDVVEQSGETRGMLIANPADLRSGITPVQGAVAVDSDRFLRMFLETLLA